LAVDEIIIRFEGQLKETTTIPNKPILTGYKVWGGSPEGVLTRMELAYSWTKKWAFGSTYSKGAWWDD
jgi:hypothetical protein